MRNDINELAAALVAAQAEMPVAKFDATNPHFKNKYATLQCMVETARPVLAKHGLCVVQGFDGDSLTTTIVHKSGQTLHLGEMALHLDRNNMQGMGSAVTYARRYAFAPAVGMVSDEDDDAQAASTPRKKVERWQDWVVPFGKSTKGKTLGELAKSDPGALMKMRSYMEQKFDPSSKFADSNRQQIDWVGQAIDSLGEADEEIPFNFEKAEGQ